MRRTGHGKVRKVERRRARRALVILLAAALGIGSVIVWAVQHKHAKTINDVLLQEFSGSYPATARSGGPVHAFEIVAAPSQARLVAGTDTQVWAYNGQIPGPELRVRLGETVRVRFTNRLPQATTIHWHGVRLPNDMDGVPTAARPAIEPGSTFVYEFTPKDAGTFWYHPHHRSSEQLERGLYGVLVVEDATPPAYHKDVVWIMDDWLLTPDRQVDPNFNTMHDLAHDGRWGNLITVNGRTDTILQLRPGERIRLRLLNAANGRVFLPDFGALHPNVIAIDGLYAREPFPLDRLEIAPGNRVDLDITLPSALALDAVVTDRFWASVPNPLATIRVDGESVGTPAFSSPAHAKVPRYPEGMNVPVTAEFLLNARRGGPFGIEWTINGHAYPDHAHVRLPLGRWSRVRFVNQSARLHPIHLHGMFFRLLARNSARVDEQFFRDTVLVHAHEMVDVAVVPLDAGEWMLHCHILEHAEAGMMTMLDVR